MAHRPDSLVVRSRVDLRTDVTKRIFINTLKKVLTVSVACEITGITRSQVYAWRNEDTAFKEAWDDAIHLAEESLESATYLKLAQALSDDRKRISMPEARLIEMFLGGAKPDKYKQRTIEIDNTQNVAISIDWSKVPDAVMDQFVGGTLTLNDVYQAVMLAEADKVNAGAASDTANDVNG